MNPVDEVEKLYQDMKAAWQYWDELASNPFVDDADIAAAGCDYSKKAEAHDKAKFAQMRNKAKQ